MDLTPDAARGALEQAGLHLGSLEYIPTAPRLVGIVTRQDPGPGTKVQPGTTINVFVGRAGPPPAGPPPVTAVTVPRVIDLTPDAARRALEQVGLHVGSIERIAAVPHLVGIVTGQDPGAGAKVQPGTRINLFVGKPGH
jgi:eukaryotic-like serine/threonine-protein kinase